MNNPKLIKRNRDGIYTIEYYENHRRKYKSLGTKDKIEAGILLLKITGFPVPITPEAEIAPGSTLYVKAVNKFILSIWGL